MRSSRDLSSWGGREEKMVGTTESDGGHEELGRDGECSFEWDEASKLYFHASSGFYHDPNAGWYYSSRDGLYYTFENGSYIPLQLNEGEDSVSHQRIKSSSQPVHVDLIEHASDDQNENHRPPSEWLEETLIDLYLSGYSNLETYAESSANEGEGHSACEQISAKSNKYYCGDSFEQREEGACADGGFEGVSESTGASLKEESWLAQYGQVVRSRDDEFSSFPATELWDWEMISETAKKKMQVRRLIGRLVSCCSKLHPSMPSNGSLLKTAAISEVHLDLVRVTSGKVYKLRSPSARYLASLSTYDSSNPTKDWGLPDISLSKGSNIAKRKACDKSSATICQVSSISDTKASTAYRDRAAERRTLHGGFGIGPGQNDPMDAEPSEDGSSSQTFVPADAAAKALNASFGSGSYARRILESMGWKDGEALGGSTKGILEPLQVVGNKGSAGLGWKNVHRGP